MRGYFPDLVVAVKWVVVFLKSVFLLCEATNEIVAMMSPSRTCSPHSHNFSGATCP